ncbi:peptidoglycan recognition protein 1-like isoform X2 [Leptidea sinapis]|uniref:peptidoglycan recognition protein 1-like isoform X2 n=1 Tax=Leptidea sinapis TaxID=189913 RepID=UPI002141FC8A|nr:peptidoglycan recognition protein 1-like isoform X2 [Leptidea sinapis]
MWNRKDLAVSEVNQCNGTVNPVLVMDDRVIASTSAAIAATPQIENLNITNSTKCHVGPKFVSVTQNVHNTEMIRELPMRNYICNLAKGTTKAERYLCFAAMVVLITFVILITLVLTLQPYGENIDDRAPHEWRITRQMWLAQPFNHSMIQFDPLMLVIVQHTVSAMCDRFVLCAAQILNLQNYFINVYEYDIPYNFLIGNDGRVYEGRGWKIEGAHTFGYNRCSVGIGFIGDYREEIPNSARVTDAQLNRTRMILDEGVRLGHLRPDYLIVGAKDLRDTASPGSNLYNAIRRWPNYDHRNRFHGLNCEQIHETFDNKSLV